MMAAAVIDEGKAVASAQALWLQDRPLDAISQYQQIWRQRINRNLGPVGKSALPNSEFHQFGPLLIETLAQL